MAWSETHILNRAKELVKVYADETLLAVDDVRIAFEEFAQKSEAFLVEESIVTVGGQRVYPLTRVIRVLEVTLNGTPLQQSRQEGTNTYQLDGNTIILNFSPDANLTLIAKGYGIPTAINGLTQPQPEQYMMEAVALMTASNYLRRYGDAQAVDRALIYSAQAAEAITEIRRRRGYVRTQRSASIVPPTRRQL